MSGSEGTREEAPSATSSEERQEALRRINKRRDLASHAFAFIVVNGAVWVLWALTGGGYPWPAWLTGLWALGLIFNAWDVYARRPITEADVSREVDRLRPQH